MQNKWTDEEKHKIIAFLQQTNSDKKRNWIMCSQFVGSKNPRQCYDYYTLQIQKEQNKLPIKQHNHKWKQYELDLLLTFQQTKMSWKEFQLTYFEKMSVCQLKNKFKVAKQKLIIEQKGNQKQFFFDQNFISLNNTPQNSVELDQSCISCNNMEYYDQIYFNFPEYE